MANRKNLIVGLVVLFAGFMLTSCVSSIANKQGSQTYPYSKLENEVFNEIDKFSKSIPKGFVRKVRRGGTFEEYRYADQESSAISEGKLRTIRCIRYSGSVHRLFVGCLNIDDDMVKQQLREKKINDYDELLQLTDFVAFTIGRPREREYEPESYVLLRKSDGLYEIVYYESRGDGTFWIRYDGVCDKPPNTEQIKQFSDRKKVPVDQVQRYIELADRFDETYSLPEDEQKR